MISVKDIFDMRKQGRIEEAYDAIRPMYAQHKGRYTTLCMFWTAADVFKLRLEQGRTDEAEKIYRALLRLLPRVEEITNELGDGTGAPTAPTATDDSKLPWEQDPQPTSSAAAFMQYAQRRLSQLAESQQSSTDANPQNSTDSTDSTDSSDSFLRDAPDDLQSCAWSLSQPQQTVFDAIRANPGARIPALSEATGIPAKTIERHIAALIAIHLIEHRGSKKTGGYYTL